MDLFKALARLDMWLGSHSAPPLWFFVIVCCVIAVAAVKMWPDIMQDYSEAKTRWKSK